MLVLSCATYVESQIKNYMLSSRLSVSMPSADNICIIDPNAKHIFSFYNYLYFESVSELWSPLGIETGSLAETTQMCLPQINPWFF